MSAAALGLAVRAAAHYAGVRGPLVHCTRLVLESDPARPSWLIVRDSHPARTREALLFDPLPRKEKPLPTPPPPADATPAELVERLGEKPLTLEAVAEAFMLFFEFHQQILVELRERVASLESEAR